MGECRLSGLLACPRHRPAELGNVTVSFRSRKFRAGALGQMAVPETALGADKAGRRIWAPLGGLMCISVSFILTEYTMHLDVSSLYTVELEGLFILFPQSVCCPPPLPLLPPPSFPSL